uniref:Uncharacterized protein n=1 Tax=Periophthalmus magnuspinnatus TaxID=409849 RepID=A0A3B4A6D7_9GOBI
QTMLSVAALLLLPLVAVGIAGAEGSKGQKGAKGESGESGVPGTDGTPGVKGDLGPKGDCDCVDGVDGAPGNKGDQGPKGEKGEAGLVGDQGVFPPPGLPVAFSKVGLFHNFDTVLKTTDTSALGSVTLYSTLSSLNTIDFILISHLLILTQMLRRTTTNKLGSGVRGWGLYTEGAWLLSGLSGRVVVVSDHSFEINSFKLLKHQVPGITVTERPGQNQDWTGSKPGQNQDWTGSKPGQNQDWTGSKPGQNQD